MRRTFWAVALGGLLLSGQAWSQECSLAIEANDQIQFNKKELRVSKSCKEVTVTLKHVGQLAANVMGHNWVLLKAGVDVTAFATAAMTAKDTDYVPAAKKGDVIASIPVLGPKKSGDVTFKRSPPPDGSHRRLHPDRRSPARGSG